MNLGAARREADNLAIFRRRKRPHKQPKPHRHPNRIRHSQCQSGRSYWDNHGVTVLPESGNEAAGLACLAHSQAFLSQTLRAQRRQRFELTIRLRSQHDLGNNPVIIRLRWADIHGNFLSPAVTLFIPRKKLTEATWEELREQTAPAPWRTAKVDLRIDAPYAGEGAGIVVKDVELRNL